MKIYPETYLPLPEVEDEDELSYSIRGNGDMVVSGPLYPHKGPGRRFMTPQQAYTWGCAKYGHRRVYLLPESLDPDTTRWALLIQYQD
jgi:hypothetical protein